jgi:hypothetical protein
MHKLVLTELFQTLQFNLAKNGIHDNILQIFKETLETSKYVVEIGSKVTKQTYGNTKKKNYSELDKEAATHHLYGHSFQAK